MAGRIERDFGTDAAIGLLGQNEFAPPCYKGILVSTETKVLSSGTSSQALNSRFQLCFATVRRPSHIVSLVQPSRVYHTERPPSGRGATGSRGSVDPPLFQVRGPHMDVDPPLLVRIS